MQENCKFEASLLGVYFNLFTSYWLSQKRVVVTLDQSPTQPVPNSDLSSGGRSACPVTKERLSSHAIRSALLPDHWKLILPTRLDMVPRAVGRAGEWSVYEFQTQFRTRFKNSPVLEWPKFCVTWDPEEHASF